MITLHLPWPPTVNLYWRSIIIKGQVRVLMSSRGRAYQRDAIAAILAEHGVCQPLKGRLTVSIRVFPPDRRKRDLDNLLKSVLDALKAAQVIKDDWLIDTLTITRDGLPVRENGAVEVTVEELPETALLFAKADQA